MFGAKYPDPTSYGSEDAYMKAVEYDMNAPLSTIHKQFILAVTKFDKSRSRHFGADTGMRALSHMNLLIADDDENQLLQQALEHYIASYILQN